MEEADDLRIVPFREDGKTCGTQTWIWAAVVGRQPLKHESILAFCKAKLAGMAPDRIFELERIPRNDMGKIIREEMREAIMKRLSSSFM